KYQRFHDLLLARTWLFSESLIPKWDEWAKKGDVLNPAAARDSRIRNDAIEEHHFSLVLIDIIVISLAFLPPSDALYLARPIPTTIWKRCRKASRGFCTSNTIPSSRECATPFWSPPATWSEWY